MSQSYQTTFDFELETNKGELYPVEVEVSIVPGYPPSARGPSDTWDPGASAEVDLLSVTKQNGEDITEKLDREDVRRLIRKAFEIDAEKGLREWGR